MLDDNDPKLTAFVLGELDAAARADVEKELENSPDLRRAVEAIRDTCDRIAAGLKAEPTPELDAEQHRAIEQELEKTGATGGLPGATQRREL